MSWLELADGVFARRYAELNLTVGLVVGSDSCLVVDTRGDAVQGRELAEAVREQTALPCTVVLTHGHFDHCFGTSAFAGANVWAHPGCAAHLVHTGDSQRAAWVAEYRAQGKPEIAEALAVAPIVRPHQLVADEVELNLGERRVRLRHLGRGHTDHDLVVHLPDVGVLFAGDLVEQGAPPDFEDAHPLDWPQTLGVLLELRPRLVVPGHGEPVDAEFVAAQRDELAALADVVIAVQVGTLTVAEAIRRSPYPESVTQAALARLR